jgi:hypothetical protein
MVFCLSNKPHQNVNDDKGGKSSGGNVAAPPFGSILDVLLSCFVSSAPSEKFLDESCFPHPTLLTAGQKPNNSYPGKSYTEQQL